MDEIILHDPCHTLRLPLRARLQTALFADPARFIGPIAGGCGVALSLVIKSFDPGSMVADPLPLALAVSGLGQILRGGLLYFDWQSPLLHLIYITGLSLTVVFIVRAVRGPAFTRSQVQRAARDAVVVNAALAAIPAIDSVLVAVFYLISGFFSVSFATGVAGRLFTLLHRVRS